MLPSPARPPVRLDTARLVLRAWEPSDAASLKAAIDRSLAHLQPWMPWALDEPSPVEVLTERLVRFRTAFSMGVEWLYGIFASDGFTVFGGAGLHPRIEPSGLEIGYWIVADHVRQGLATEAAGALTAVALALPGIDHVEIRCDPANVASAAVPRRLGYTHVRTLVADTMKPDGSPRDTMVWRRTTGEPRAAGT